MKVMSDFLDSTIQNIQKNSVGAISQHGESNREYSKIVQLKHSSQKYSKFCSNGIETIFLYGI